MEVGQGPNWGCSAKEKINVICKGFNLKHILFVYISSSCLRKNFRQELGVSECSNSNIALCIDPVLILGNIRFLRSLYQR
jgi:hypothetical protein